MKHFPPTFDHLFDDDGRMVAAADARVGWDDAVDHLLSTKNKQSGVYWGGWIFGHHMNDVIFCNGKGKPTLSLICSHYTWRF